jgi:hypothetical protein
MSEYAEKVKSMVSNFIRGKMQDAESEAKDLVRAKTADHISAETGLDREAIYPSSPDSDSQKLDAGTPDDNKGDE